MPWATFVLVHSPLVGPDTWAPVAEVLRDRGEAALVPELPVATAPPYGEGQVSAVTGAVVGTVDRGEIVLVLHSGAGQLSALIGRSLADAGATVAAYVLADAGLPTGGSSRLEQMRRESPERAEQLEALLRDGGAFPAWGDADLAPLVPDRERRDRLIAGLRPQPLPYWTEPLPDVPGWPDAPVGLLLLSEGYVATAAHARQAGWPVHDLATGNHFAMLDDPERVADELREMAGELTRR